MPKLFERLKKRKGVAQILPEGGETDAGLRGPADQRGIHHAVSAGQGVRTARQQRDQRPAERIFDLRNRNLPFRDPSQRDVITAAQRDGNAFHLRTAVGFVQKKTVDVLKQGKLSVNMDFNAEIKVAAHARDGIT